MNIVQIGTCQANDDLTKIIGNNQPTKLVLVEPLKIHNEKILECYNWVNNIFLENIAIVPEKKDDQITFYYHIGDAPLYEVANTTIQHILKHGAHVGDPNGIRELKVDTMNINELFYKHNMKKIDILFIDAEGLDDLIIKSIDFNNFEIDLIYFENLHLTQKDIYYFLENKGYSINSNVLSNGWCSSATKIK